MALPSLLSLPLPRPRFLITGSTAPGAKSVVMLKSRAVRPPCVGRSIHSTARSAVATSVAHGRAAALLSTLPGLAAHEAAPRLGWSAPLWALFSNSSRHSPSPKLYSTLLSTRLKPAVAATTMNTQWLDTADTLHFSTSSRSSVRSSKEEEDLYQALTVSFRNRIAEQEHKPEDSYKSMIENWTHLQTQREALTHKRTRALKDRLAAAVQHREMGLIQKEQDRFLLERNGTSDDYFYLIQAWIRCGELKRATVAFEQLEKESLISNGSTGRKDYGNSGGKQKKPLVTIKILAAMIRAHSRAGNLATAGSMVQKMSQQKLKPTSIYDLSALLEYTIRVANAQANPLTTPEAGSETLTNEIQRTEVPHSALHSREIGLGTLQESLDPNKAQVHLIWEAIEPQLKPTNAPSTSPLPAASASRSNNSSFAYRTYLTYLVNKASDMDRAAELVDRLYARSISPELEKHPKTAFTTLQNLTQNGYLTEAQKLLDQSDGAVAKAIPEALAAKAWSDLMEAYMYRKEFQRARWAYNDMIRHGIVPNTVSKKIYVDLQQMHTTEDRDDGNSSHRAGGNKNNGNDEGGTDRREIQTGPKKRSGMGFLSILFDRDPKPALS